VPAPRRLDDLDPLLVSRAEALARGRTPEEVRWLLRTGRWTALRRGLYVPTGELAPPDDPHRRFWLEALALYRHLERPTAAFSHATAARMWGLQPSRSAESTLRLTDLTGSHRGREFWIGEGALPSAEVRRAGPLRLTSPARTLVDCAREWSEIDAVASIDDALLRDRVELPALREVLERTPRRPGHPAAVRAVARADGRAESWLESAWRVRHLAAGLPRPELQVEIWIEGRLVKVVDGWFPDAALAVECDGRVKYDRPYRDRTPAQVLWEEKRAEDALRAVGIRVVRVVSDDVGPGWPAMVARTRRELAAPVPPLGAFRAVPRSRGRARPR
jgi:hypothetical protein